MRTPLHHVFFYHKDQQPGGRTDWTLTWNCSRHSDRWGFGEVAKISREAMVQTINNDFFFAPWVTAGQDFMNPPPSSFPEWSSLYDAKWASCPRGMARATRFHQSSAMDHLCNLGKPYSVWAYLLIYKMRHHSAQLLEKYFWTKENVPGTVFDTEDTVPSSKISHSRTF